MIRSSITPKARKGKCRICRELFTKTRAIQPVCDKFDCKVAYASRAAEKSIAKRAREAKRGAAAERKKDAEKKLTFKKKGYWFARAQKAFNAFIRERDRQAGLPCISSGKPLDWSGNQVDAGHFRSVGSAPHLRFNENNCHAQSKYENKHRAGNHVAYRILLIERIGLPAVEELEADNEPRHWSIEDLKEIEATYKAKLKELKGRA